MKEHGQGLKYSYKSVANGTVGKYVLCEHEGLLCKHEDLGLDLQPPCKEPVSLMRCTSPVLLRTEKQDHWALLAASPALVLLEMLSQEAKVDSG